ncbi:hypothetical protein FS749_016522 [Ceratobasidium sp. UAMH 11750]|nr:hypothetical protein FS749_016522 [Ceratobasidium sp. UAMH 11750]
MSTMAQLMMDTTGWTLEQAGLHCMHWFLMLTEPEERSTESTVIDLCDSADPVASSESELDSDSGSSCEAEIEDTAPPESQELLSPPPPKGFKQTQLPFASISRQDWLMQEQ